MLMKNNLFLKLFGIIIFFSTCTILNKKPECPISAVENYSELPILNPITKEFNLKGGSIIYFMDDMVFYRVPYVNTTYKNKEIYKNGDTTNIDVYMDESNVLSKETNYHNYIFRKNNLKGLMYDSIMVDSARVFEVETFFNRNTQYRNNSLDKLFFFIKQESKLVSVTKDKKTNIVCEKYVSLFKPSSSETDSIYIYYLPQKQFKNVNFSLSEKVDSLKKRKFFQFKGIYNDVPKNDTQKVDYPRREIVLRINEIEVKNQDEIAAFFERFKKDSKLLK